MVGIREDKNLDTAYLGKGQLFIKSRIPLHHLHYNFGDELNTRMAAKLLL